jgi:hypothetical protein
MIRLSWTEVDGWMIYSACRIDLQMMTHYAPKDCRQYRSFLTEALRSTTLRLQLALSADTLTSNRWKLEPETGSPTCRKAQDGYSVCFHAQSYTRLELNQREG